MKVTSLKNLQLQAINLQLERRAHAGGLVSVFPGEDFAGSLHMRHDMLQRKPVATQSSFGTATRSNREIINMNFTTEISIFHNLMKAMLSHYPF
jgi:hypothetical protein